MDYQSTNPYIVSKISAELILNSYRCVFDYVHCLRPFFMYGAYQNKRMLFGQLIHKIKSGIPIEIGLHGGLVFNPIFINDACKIVHGLMQKKSAELSCLNLGGSEQLVLEDVIVRIAEYLNRKPIVQLNSSPLNYCVLKSKYSLIEKYTSIEQGLETILSS